MRNEILDRDELTAWAESQERYMDDNDPADWQEN